MRYGSCFAISPAGSSGNLVEIEACINNGLPSLQLIGLPDTSLQEAKERFKVALLSSGFTWPTGKVVISLYPASLPKIGSRFDLGLAVAMFCATQTSVNSKKSNGVFIGELSLSGKVRKVEGVLQDVMAAKEQGLPLAVVPWENLSEAAQVPGITVLGAKNLAEVLAWLTDESELSEGVAGKWSRNKTRLDYSEVLGQDNAKFALEVAASGGHNILMLGSPGVGKTMLAKRFPTILPDLDLEQSLEVTAIHSQAGKINQVDGLITTPPFIAPHYKSTLASIIGGGTNFAQPGAITLANRGVLFLDEFSEIGVKTLESLRTPLEEGVIRLARRNGIATFPAEFQLILAANPCPCAPVRDIDCVCTPSMKNKYNQKMSGPLLDRVDISIKLYMPSLLEIKESKVESSAQIKQRVKRARERALLRWGKGNYLNAKVPKEILKSVVLPELVLDPLYRLINKSTLSLRGMDRIIRLAWTIADLKAHPLPDANDVKVALSLRESNYELG